MKTSAAVVITNGAELLMVHPTGKTFWEIPKGIQEEGEAAYVAAARELQEETGLTPRPEEFVAFGEYSYLKNKNLNIFCIFTKKLPPTKDMHCVSTFDGTTPEVDKYGYMTWDEAYEVSIPAMSAVLKTLREEIAHFNGKGTPKKR